jgi:hypothetical protein
MIAELEVPEPGSEPLKFDSVYAQSWGVQFQALLWKNAKTYWRFPEYNAIRYVFSLVIALIIGTVFLGLGSKRGTQQDVLNGEGLGLRVIDEERVEDDGLGSAQHLLSGRLIS